MAAPSLCALRFALCTPAPMMHTGNPRIPSYKNPAAIDFQSGDATALSSQL